MSFLDDIRSKRGERKLRQPPRDPSAPSQAAPGDVVVFEPWAAPSERDKPSESEARREGARAAAEILRRQQEARQVPNE